MLKIKNLHASVDGKEILKGIDLEIKAGEVHAIMGPNGAGKSTLSAVLTGRERFEVTQGEVEFNGKNLLENTSIILKRYIVFNFFSLHLIFCHFFSRKRCKKRCNFSTFTPRHSGARS